MPLQRNLIELPIVGGPDQKADAILSNRPTQMVNCIERKTGAIEKRYGYDAIGQYNARLGGGAPPAPEMLATRGDELVRIGSGEIDSYAVIGSTDWVSKGRIPEAAATSSYAALGAQSSLAQAEPTVAVCGGYIVLAYVAYLTGAATNGIIIEVTSATTGATVLGPIVVESGAGFLNPRVVADGTTFGVFWFNGAGAIRGRFYSVTTMGPIGAAAAVVAAGVFSPGFDVVVKSSSQWTFAYVSTLSGTPDVVVYAITSGFVGAAGPVTLAVNEPDTYSLSVDAVDGERIYVGWCRRTAGTYYVKFGTLSSAFALPVYVTVVTALGDVMLNVGVRRFSAGNAVIAWTLRNSGVNWWEMSQAAAGGAITAGLSGGVLDTMLLARPLVVSGRGYLWLSNVHGTHSTAFLADISLGAALLSGTVPRLVLTLFPRRLRAQRGVGPSGTWDSNAEHRYLQVANTAIVSGGEHVVALNGVGEDDASIPAGSWASNQEVHIARFAFSGWTRTAAEVNGVLVLSGGAPSTYDGGLVAEIGFAYEPDWDKCAALASSAAGGSLAAGQTYGYAIVYAWTDAQGNVQRSAPSRFRSITLGGADNRVTGTVPTLSITNKFRGGADETRVVIEIYRTAQGGATYYFNQQIQNVANGAPLAFTDTVGDAVLTLRRVLYTTGGVVANTIPPSATVASTYRGSVVLGGTDDGSVYFSKPLVIGDGPAFSGALTQSVFEGGQVTALADLYGSLVIAKADSLYRIGGDPPADNGASSLTTPERISIDVGCTDVRSVVSTPEGVMMAGRTGIVLVDRGFGVQHVGKAVETTVGAGAFAGAALVSSQNLVRFALLGTAKVVGLDYYHSRLRGAPQWNVDMLWETIDDVAAEIGACTMWRGAFVWIDTSGWLYQESTAHHLDKYPIGGTSTWVDMTFETAVAKVQGPQAYARFWDVSLLGDAENDAQYVVTITTDLGTQTRTWATYTPSDHARFAVHCKYQLASWMRVKVVDSYNGAGVIGTGKGLVLRSIQAHVGTHGKIRPTSSANMK
jgi:hypothetical protein